MCGDPEANATASTPVDEAGVHELEVWQHDLNVVGCWAGAEDGQLGPQTEAAIRNYQTNAGLPVTGELDAMTEETLAESAAEAARSATPPQPRRLTRPTTAAAPPTAVAAATRPRPGLPGELGRDLAEPAAGAKLHRPAGGRGHQWLRCHRRTEQRDHRDEARPDRAAGSRPVAALNAAGYSGRYFCGVYEPGWAVRGP